MCCSANGSNSSDSLYLCIFEQITVKISQNTTLPSEDRKREILVFVYVDLLVVS